MSHGDEQGEEHKVDLQGCAQVQDAQRRRKRADGRLDATLQRGIGRSLAGLQQRHLGRRLTTLEYSGARSMRHCCRQHVYETILENAQI